MVADAVRLTLPREVSPLTPPSVQYGGVSGVNDRADTGGYGQPVLQPDDRPSSQERTRVANASARPLCDWVTSSSEAR